MCWTRQHLSCRPFTPCSTKAPRCVCKFGTSEVSPSAAKCSAAWQHWRLWVAGSDAKAALILGSTFRRKATTFMVLLLHGAEGMFVPWCFMLFGILPAEESCRPAFLRCPFLDLLFISAFLPHPFAYVLQSRPWSKFQQIPFSDWHTIQMAEQGIWKVVLCYDITNYQSFQHLEARTHIRIFLAEGGLARTRCTIPAHTISYSLNILLAIELTDPGRTGCSWWNAHSTRLPCCWEPIAC